MTHDEAMQAGLEKIARDYADPPPEGATVPRGWVEENLPELCGREIRYITPLGDPRSEPCDLTRGHDSDCDSSQLLLRPANTPKIPLGE